MKKLPDSPGVYLFKDTRGEVIYVGKATSLKKRVAQYFGARQEAEPRPITTNIAEVASVKTLVTPTVLEAVILEANLIKKYWPKYNIINRDDRSFLYLIVTKDAFPKLLTKRGTELATSRLRSKYKFSVRASAVSQELKGYSHMFGPFLSLKTLTAALRILRRIFHWSNCPPVSARPCFYYHLGQCPGICVGEISAAEYRRRVIKNMVWFFAGRKNHIILSLKKKMKNAVQADNFEEAAKLRNQIFALEHIQDMALLERETLASAISKLEQGAGVSHLLQRIEGYDISNLGGELATGSMVVWRGSGLDKSEYRKFRVKTAQGSNDIAMLGEVLRRRFDNPWSLPSLVLVDGGKAQVNIARQVLKDYHLDIPVMGIAKGPTRKKDEFIFDERNPELGFLARHYSRVLKQLRDEAHRFAVKYHRQLRKIK